jgi:hypothetical protein
MPPIRSKRKSKEAAACRRTRNARPAPWPVACSPVSEAAPCPENRVQHCFSQQGLCLSCHPAIRHSGNHLAARRPSPTRRNGFSSRPSHPRPHQTMGRRRRLLPPPPRKPHLPQPRRLFPPPPPPRSPHRDAGSDDGVLRRLARRPVALQSVQHLRYRGPAVDGHCGQAGPDFVGAAPVSGRRARHSPLLGGAVGPDMRKQLPALVQRREAGRRLRRHERSRLLGDCLREEGQATRPRQPDQGTVAASSRRESLGGPHARELLPARSATPCPAGRSLRLRSTRGLQARQPGSEAQAEAHSIGRLGAQLSGDG